MSTQGDGSGEKRRALRSRCLRGGQCVFNDGFSNLTVLVRNISATGAKLTGDELIHLPDQFELQISDGYGGFASRWVRRVWSRTDSMGVEFIDGERAQSTPRGVSAAGTAVAKPPLRGARSV